MPVLIIILFLGLLNPAYCGAQVTEKKPRHQQSGIKLSTELLQRLKDEMLTIEKAMQNLVSTTAKADWQKTAEIAKQIQASFIIKQSLTTDQIKQLHQGLPAQFIELDHSFHHHAGMLAHAAEAKNAEAVAFYFYKLNDGCRQCHTKYAQETFPGFAGNLEINHH